MNLLDAFKQYIRDAMPGGALNPEVTTQGVLDAAALGTAPVPIVGDAIGLAADVRRLAKNPEERTPMNYGLTALGALPFVPGGLAGMFVGKGAKIWDAISAAKAKELADKGVDARQIWKETGTFRGPDGHWRQEIDDSGATFIDKFRKATSQEFDDFFKAKVTVKEVDDLKSAARQSGDFSIPKFYGDKPGLYDKYRSAKDTISKYERQFMNPSEIKKGPLGNFLDHDKLDAAYPSLYDIPTTHNKNHSGGAFFENMNELLIGGTQEKSTTLHELQHAIQGKEGWARGGSPESMPKIISELIDQGAAKAQKLRSLAYRGDPLDPFDVVKPGALDKALDTEMGVRRLKDWQARLNAFPDSYTNDAYRSLAGEAEARATQARMNMNAAQRREVFPLDSYDVPLDELIVRWGGDGPAMSVAPKAPQAQALETAQRNAVTMLGLPPNNTAMDRAKALGFEDVYHSSLADVAAFKPHGKFAGHQGVSGVSVTDSPEMASRYLDRYADYGWVNGVPNQPFSKNVMPLMIRKGKTLEAQVSPYKAKARGPLGAPLPADYRNPMIDDGIDTLIVPDAISRRGAVKHSDAKNAIKGNELIVANPASIRSRFAAFDPARINENDLLGRADLGLLGLLAGGSAGLAYARSDKDKKDKK